MWRLSGSQAAAHGRAPSDSAIGRASPSVIDSTDALDSPSRR
jgi:hypothetical protein